MRVALIITLVALALACGRRQAVPIESVLVPPTPPPTAVPQPPAPVPAEPLPATRSAPDRVVFRIGDQAYTQDYVDLQRAAHVATCESLGVEPVPEGSFVNWLIDDLLLFRAAQRHPITADPVLLARVEAERRSLISDYFVQRVLYAEITVTPEEIEAHYRANLDRYTQPEQICLRRIQIEDMADAEEALRRLAIRGEDFDLVAQAMGVTATPPTWFSRGQLPLTLEQAAFTLDIGEISTVVSTDIGHFILTKVAEIPERVRPLEEVSSEIRAELLRGRQRRLLREFLAAERLAEGIEGPPVLVP